ncbi:hypothetical protein NFI96_002230 [Prochilodus magdalenae]|nr:hypothetical protein NFI96_002230 [Prochilodus magdalenae]
MSSTIKELTLTYDPVNQTNTFTNGDVIQGRVVLEVAKEEKINSFYIKCKGDADVSWSEKQDNDDNDRDMPPSFTGYHGSIKYILEVKLKRSWKLDCTERTEFNFVPKTALNVNLMSPQSAATDKKMKLFTSGNASFRTTIDKMGYMQGDVIRASTFVDNSSSRKLKLKYRFEQKQVFYAQGNYQNSSVTIFKVVGDPIPSGSKQTINTDLRIPSNLKPSIANCGIIKLEYILKVYLDVPYAIDPEIKFPVCLLPMYQPLGQQPSFQPDGPNPPPQAAFGPNLPFQAASASGPPDGPLGPVPGFYPSLHPYPYAQSANPEAPPPSYTDLYPNQNPTGFQSPPSAPPYNPLSYSTSGYSDPSASQQHPATSVPDFGPSAPPYSQAGNVPGYWPNSANPTHQPEPNPKNHQ